MKTFAAALISALASATEWGQQSYYQPSYQSYKPSYQSYQPSYQSYQPARQSQAASKQGAAQYSGAKSNDYDAYARDQDLSIEESYGKTNAKSYNAESYDEWDNKDADTYGAQAWGQDRDVYGASSYGKAASQGDYDRYGKSAKVGSYGHGNGYGHGSYGNQSYNAQVAQKDQAASKSYGASKAGYDNDAWAKTATSSDYDSRWGKSYDSVNAKSYDNENYSKSVQADDDVWAEDYAQYNRQGVSGYGKAASAKSTGGYGGYGSYGGYGHDNNGSYSAASKAGAAQYGAKDSSKWDAYGRDQDLAIQESYDNTNAKSYAAESYDEWDNKDDDRTSAQAWGQDRDAYGASSYGKAASAGDYGRYGKSASNGSNYGGYGGYGHGSYGQGNNAYSAYGAEKQYGASAEHGAAAGAYDNDTWAKQAYGIDTDSRWGKSYDSVDAKSYDNEQYARKVQADDDQWAENYNQWDRRGAQGYGKAASTQTYQPARSYGHGW